MEQKIHYRYYDTFFKKYFIACSTAGACRIAVHEKSVTCKRCRLRLGLLVDKEANTPCPICGRTKTHDVLCENKITFE